MTDDQDAPQTEANDEAVTKEEVTTPEPEQSEEGGGTQPEGEADAEAEAPKEEELSDSQKRRRAKKARMAQLYTEAEEAKARRERQQKIFDGGPEPQEDAYVDPTEYAIDKALWRERQASHDRQIKQVDAELEQINQQSAAERQSFWQDQMADARTRHQDFDQIALGGHWQPTPAMTEAITSSDMGADVAYFLGANAHEAARIAQLPPMQQVREIGRIEATLTAPKPKTETAAPAPIKPVKPRGGAEKDPSKMTMAEYSAWRKKQR